MELASLSRPELIFPRLEATEADAVLHELALRIGQAGAVADAEELYERLQEREGLCSTGIGRGVAVPHCKLPGLKEPMLAVGISRKAIDFGSLDGEPVRLFFVVASPEKSPAVHLKVLSAISHLIQREGKLGSLLEEKKPEAILEILARPPGGS